MENITMKKHMGMKAKNAIANSIIYVILISMMIVWLIPFVFIFFESFRTEVGYQVGYILPKKWGFDNYIKLFNETGFLKWFGNSMIIGIACSILQTVMQLSVSYALSRLRFKGRKLIMNLMLILGMFPGFLSMILLYRVLSWLGLTGSGAIPGLILVYCASSGMGYHISKGFFDTIPKSLDEAARVDGATRFQVFYKVIMPLAKPIIIYTVLNGFMAPWGDFMFAKYIAHFVNDGMTSAVGLQSLIAALTSNANYYVLFCAGGVIVALPITILFMFLQRYYVEGVTGGAVKG